MTLPGGYEKWQVIAVTHHDDGDTTLTMQNQRGITRTENYPAGTVLTRVVTTYCSTECASHRCTRPCGRVTEHPADEAGHLCDSCASVLIGWF